MVTQILPFNLGPVWQFNQVHYEGGGAEDEYGGGQVVPANKALIEEADRVKQVNEYVWTDLGATQREVYVCTPHVANNVPSQHHNRAQPPDQTFVVRSCTRRTCFLDLDMA